jgi:predicted MFS family arabinose efflux permease
VMGVSQSVASLSRVLGPFAAGFCFAAFGRNAAFLWGAVLVAAALLVALKLPRRVVARPVEAGPLGRESGPA